MTNDLERNAGPGINSLKETKRIHKGKFLNHLKKNKGNVYINIQVYCETPHLVSVEI